MNDEKQKKKVEFLSRKFVVLTKEDKETTDISA